jgi:hypothetical protein
VARWVYTRLAIFFLPLAKNMHLLYVDESGNPDGMEDKYFVLGGVAVFEREIYWINEQVNAIATKYFPSVQIEFHTQAIASHREEPWHSCPTEQRNQIIDELCATISSRHVTLFGIALEKATSSDPIARAFEEICNRCDLFLRRLHSRGDTQRALIIFDETRYENSLQTLLAEYRSLGTRYGSTVKNFADVPFFANSKATRLLQLADLVAYAVFRRYERGDTRLLDKIISKFDTDDGVIHGLVHLTRSSGTCTCPACLTRRPPRII